MRNFKAKIQVYYLTAIFSFIFAIVGFTYNAWRMEASEENNNVRTAAFEVLQNLAELEQNIYAAHYDNDKQNGSPRIGWVKVGLVLDLSLLVSDDVYQQAMSLKGTWRDSWVNVENDQVVVEKLVADIDKVRTAIKETLQNLQ